MSDQPTQPKPDQTPTQSQYQATTPTAPPNSINVSTLGYFLDGWADLIEGMATKVEEVRAGVLKGLKERNMPEIQVSDKTGYVSLVSGGQREYTITTTSPGATTTIYVGKHGNDLYASWRTFIRPVLNMQTLGVMIFIAAIIGLLTGGIRETGSSLFGGYTQAGLSLSGWVVSTVLLLILGAIILLGAGRIIKGNMLAYFFVEPNVFDADDITAMSLTVHKTLFKSA